MRGEHGGGRFSMFLINQAEYAVVNGGDGYRWDAEAWYGGDINRVVAALNAQGIQADASPDVDVLVNRVIEEAQPNDVLLVMSNGAFGGFIPTLLEGLRKRFGA